MDPSDNWRCIHRMIFFCIGLYDDWLSINRKKNKGLSARSKFILQVVVSLIWLIGVHHFVQPMSVIDAIWFVFLLTGTSNATNLTDGLDGLLATLMVISLAGLLLAVHSLGAYDFVGLIGVFVASLVIFLLFNWRPAKLFMGDTGSLMCGAF